MIKICAVVDLIPVLSFGFAACSFTQFFFGIIAMYNFLKGTNDMENFILHDLMRWVGASAGMFTVKSGLMEMKALKDKYEYNKVKSGVSSTADFGIENLRLSCPHFNDWLNRIEEKFR